MLKGIKENFIEWILKKAFIFLIEVYDKFGKVRVMGYLDRVMQDSDEYLEGKFGKEGSKQIQKEFLDVGEEYVILLKKEIND